MTCSPLAIRPRLIRESPLAWIRQLDSRFSTSSSNRVGSALMTQSPSMFRPKSISGRSMDTVPNSF